MSQTIQHFAILLQQKFSTKDIFILHLCGNFRIRDKILRQKIKSFCKHSHLMGKQSVFLQKLVILANVVQITNLLSSELSHFIDITAKSLILGKEFMNEMFTKYDDVEYLRLLQRYLYFIIATILWLLNKERIKSKPQTGW